MKKTIWMVLTVLLAVSCSGKQETRTASASGSGTASVNSSGGSTATVKAGTPAPASDFTVQLNYKGDGVEITDYSGNAKSLTIPATIEDLPVVKVTFSSLNPNVEQLFIPEGVKEAGIRGGNSNNPGGFPNLRAVSLPNTLERLYGNAFIGCANLKSVSIPPSVTSIGIGAFSGTGIQSIVIPASVEGTIDGVFKDCKSLTSVEISGNNLTVVNFSGCDNLKSAIINEGVVRIGYGTFMKFKLLETVKLPDSLGVIGERAFAECSSLSTIVIPKGVEYIETGAFARSGLTEVTILKTDKPLSLFDRAFGECENLETINFGEGISIKFFGKPFEGSKKLSLKTQAAIKALGGSF